MEYVGLDKERFGKFMKELVIMYSDISKEKAKIYYEYFSTKKIVQPREEYKKYNFEVIDVIEESKRILYRIKKTNWFPTIAELEEVYYEAYKFLVTKSENEWIKNVNGGF